ncbi:MAG: Cold shock protein of CSP family, partial [uncultured Acidimicrobiales bacterium]
GNRYCEVLQRGKGLRLHLPPRRRRRVRPLLQHRGLGLQDPRGGPAGRVRRRPWAQGRRGPEGPGDL